MVRAGFVLLLALLLPLAAGCSHVISNDSLKQVDTSVTFRAVRQEPDNFAGKYLLVGGAIAAVRNTEAGGELEVVEFGVDCYGKPLETSSSDGRLLAQSPNFLDPMIFRRGLMVTMVGEIAGKRSEKLEGVNYSYPVLKVRELYLWRPDQVFPSGPTFHFGVMKGF